MKMAQHLLDVKHFSQCSPLHKRCAFWHSGKIASFSPYREINSLTNAIPRILSDEPGKWLRSPRALSAHYFGFKLFSQIFCFLILIWAKHHFSVKNSRMVSSKMLQNIELLLYSLNALDFVSFPLFPYSSPPIPPCDYMATPSMVHRLTWPNHLAANILHIAYFFLLSA